MNRISKSRQKQLEEYCTLRGKFLKEHPVCEYPGCVNKAVECHHSKGRVGRLLCDVRHFRALCSTCHRFTHDNPQAARDAGMLCSVGEFNTYKP